MVRAPRGHHATPLSPALAAFTSLHFTSLSRALAAEAPRFVAKVAQLPPVRKRAHRKPNKVPDVKDEFQAPEPEPEPQTVQEE